MSACPSERAAGEFANAQASRECFGRRTEATEARAELIARRYGVTPEYARQIVATEASLAALDRERRGDRAWWGPVLAGALVAGAAVFCWTVGAGYLVTGWLSERRVGRRLRATRQEGAR